MNTMIFSTIMNFIAAVILIGIGAKEMNNLVTSIPAIFCGIAGICGIMEIKKKQK